VKINQLRFFEVRLEQDSDFFRRAPKVSGIHFSVSSLLGASKISYDLIENDLKLNFKALLLFWPSNLLSVWNIRSEKLLKGNIWARMTRRCGILHSGKAEFKSKVRCSSKCPTE